MIRGPRGAFDLRRITLAEESYPDDLRYHAEHDWARIEGDEATLGITWYAQDTLGEIVFLDCPGPGTELAKGSPYAEVESVKAVSDVFAPLSGEILEVNGAAAENPEIVNEDPYGKGWLVRVRLSDPAEAGELLNAEAYRGLLADQG
jgi:glycine cleavage system H protein